MSDHVHASHPAIVKRLARAGGHLRSIVDMIEAHRPCAEIAQQLHAVERAIGSAKRAMIEDHIDHCLSSAPDADPTAVVEEFRAIAKFL
jgi:uncharacterized protein